MNKIQQKLLMITAIIITIVVLLTSNAFYIVNQVNQVIVVRFGEVVRVVSTPGLKTKIPFIENLVYFDKRFLGIWSQPKEMIAFDQKRVIVDAFAKYKIVNPLLFFQSVRNETRAEARMESILESSLREVLGTVPLSELLREGGRKSIMVQIRNKVNKSVKPFGIKMFDVRIRRADLPEKNSEAIYRRMQTEREREAKEFRAKGMETAQIIRAKADREKVFIIAEAKEKSETVKGQADAVASKIFSDSYRKDPRFYEFYRSMVAYKEVFLENETNQDTENTKDKQRNRFVLSSDSKFLKFINK